MQLRDTTKCLNFQTKSARLFDRTRVASRDNKHDRIAVKIVLKLFWLSRKLRDPVEVEPTEEGERTIPILGPEIVVVVVIRVSGVEKFKERFIGKVTKFGRVSYIAERIHHNRVADMGTNRSSESQLKVASNVWPYRGVIGEEGLETDSVIGRVA